MLLRIIVQRLLWTPVVLLLVTFATFLFAQFGPGDPVQILAGRRAGPEVVERIRHERGLDRPFYVQYADYIWKALHGDLGESYAYRNQKVSELIFPRIWVSAQLNLMAIAITLSLGIPLGVFAAMKQGSWLDTATVTMTLVLMSMSVFFTVPALQILLARQLGWVPVSGWGGLFDLRIIIPALALGIPPVASITRLMRASTLEVASQDYVRTARAKGLPERMVITRHIVRNAILPIWTIFGFMLASLFAGTFVVEVLAGIPGIGRLTVESLFARDYPVLLAVFTIGAVSFVFANLVIDLGYRVVDPRIRVGE